MGRHAVRIWDMHDDGSIDIEGSPNVIINSRLAHRKFDADTSSIQLEASPTVIVNGRGQARFLDKNMSGIPELTFSPNVVCDG